MVVSTMMVASESRVNHDEHHALKKSVSITSINLKVEQDEGHIDETDEDMEMKVKCSAVHTMERDIPAFDYTHLVDQLRALILADHEANPGLYGHNDIERCKIDQWFLSRYLLRCKLDMDNAFAMLRRSLRYRNESLLYSVQPHDFPREFYRLGALFKYEPDRKGNVMVYIRVRYHRTIKEIQELFRGFLMLIIELADQEAKGKGIAIVIDCTGAGYANADMNMLSFLVQSLVNYFPKGLSYFLVHELPWILKPFWHIAKAWLSDEHRQLIKFSNSKTIFEYVDQENLPDYMGGTCQRDYCEPPENCSDLNQAAKLWGIEKELVNKVLSVYADDLPDDCKPTIE